MGQFIFGLSEDYLKLDDKECVWQKLFVLLIKFLFLKN